MNNNLEQFLLTYKADNKSEKTIETYRRNIIKFFKLLNDKDFKDITKMDVELIKLKIKNQKARTINLMLESTRMFFEYLVQENLLEKNILNDVKKVKEEQAEIVYLTLEEAKEFLNVVETTSNRNQIRNSLLFNVMVHCGLRVSEVSNIKLDDIDITNKEIRVTGKGNKQRIAVLNDKLIDLIESYKRARFYQNEYLFITNNNTQLSVKSIQDQLKFYINKTAITKNISPHKLRHTFATLMYANDVDIFTLKELLGHSNLKTTSIYTHLIDENVKSKVNKCNPLL